MIIEIQEKRDEHCSQEGENSGWKGPLFARYNNFKSETGQERGKWRCYCKDALTRDRKQFDSLKSSDCHFSSNNDSLQELPNKGKFRVERSLLVMSTSTMSLIQVGIICSSVLPCNRELYSCRQLVQRNFALK